jgi:hypothetical protein
LRSSKGTMGKNKKGRKKRGSKGEQESSAVTRPENEAKSDEVERPVKKDDSTKKKSNKRKKELVESKKNSLDTSDKATSTVSKKQKLSGKQIILNPLDR